MTSHSPLPELDDINRFFWTSGADGRLRVQRCESCGFWLHPPGLRCPECGSRKLAPTVVSGRGTVEAVTVNHQAWSPGQEVPFAIAIVSLEEAPSVRLTARMVGVDVDAVFIGQRVRVQFEASEDVFLPVFTPMEEGSHE
jgi:uncharacterized OB-fold protein